MLWINQQILILYKSYKKRYVLIARLILTEYAKCEFQTNMFCKRIRCLAP